MSISISQLKTWSNQGATATPKQLREKIERVLRGEESLITDKGNLSIYLQGSYRNSTNIYGNSDVDIVVQTNHAFYSDVSRLSEEKKVIYEKNRNPSQYTWSIYKKEIIDTLVNYFGADKVIIGNKSIKIETEFYEADVVPCMQFRSFIDYGYSSDSQEFIEGVKFYTTKDYREVVNYPKRHYSFGVEKNKQTSQMYKPTVRIFKNMKETLINLGKLNKGTAPSYFIENLLYNVPADKFIYDNYWQTVFNILNWLADNRNNMSTFICQNRMVYLFGLTEEQWKEDDARIFLNECINFWNEWGK